MDGKGLKGDAGLNWLGWVSDWSGLNFTLTNKLRRIDKFLQIDLRLNLELTALTAKDTYYGMNPYPKLSAGVYATQIVIEETWNCFTAFRAFSCSSKIVSPLAVERNQWRRSCGRSTISENLWSIYESKLATIGNDSYGVARSEITIWIPDRPLCRLAVDLLPYRFYTTDGPSSSRECANSILPDFDPSTILGL